MFPGGASTSSSDTRFSNPTSTIQTEALNSLEVLLEQNVEEDKLDRTSSDFYSSLQSRGRQCRVRGFIGILQQNVYFSNINDTDIGIIHRIE